MELLVFVLEYFGVVFEVELFVELVLVFVMLKGVLKIVVSLLSFGLSLNNMV